MNALTEKIMPLSARSAPAALTFQVSLDAVRAGRASTQHDERKPFKTITRGNVSLPIYGSKRGPWTIAWREAAGGQRFRKKKSDLKKAIAFAEKKATELANGEAWRSRIGPADFAAYQRCLQLAADVQAPVELLVAEAVAARQRGRTLVVKKCPAIVADYLGTLEVCGKWRRVLTGMFERIAEGFPGPLTEYGARDFEGWLEALKVGRRTRRNYHDALQALIGYARKKFVPADFDPLAEVKNPEPLPRRPNIYAPEAFEWLLHFAESPAGGKTGRKLVPFMCITAFAFVRHGEMNEEEKEGALDWRNVRFKTKRIFIPPEAAKRTNRADGDGRVVDMPDNLVAWLKPYAQPAGRICDLANTADALCKFRKRAAAAALQEAEVCGNATRAEQLRRIGKELLGCKRNALRKSCISYRKALTRDIAGVADGAGNSATMIKRNYLHVDEEMEELAKRWFAILPQSTGALPLFEWGQQARR